MGVVDFKNHFIWYLKRHQYFFFLAFHLQFLYGVTNRLSPSLLLHSLDLLLKCELSFNNKHSTWMLFSKSSVLSTVTLNTDTPVYEESKLTLRPDLLGNLQPNSEQKYRSISRINPLWLTTNIFAGSFEISFITSTSQLFRLVLSQWSSSVS